MYLKPFRDEPPLRSAENADRFQGADHPSARNSTRPPAAAARPPDSRPAVARAQLEQTSRPGRPSEHTRPRQLELVGIIGVWAAAALPMGLLAWVGAPLLANQLGGSGRLARALIISLTAGLIWQFALVLILVSHEQQTLRWTALRSALWLRAPRSPRTGRRGGRSWLIIVPPTVAFAGVQLVPSLPHPAGRDFGKFLQSHAGKSLLAGSWGWLITLVALFIFNTVLGEELLFRGYLLPRMKAVCGRRDWLANGALFGAYHLHMPWAIPASMLNGFIFASTSERSRSALAGIAVHSMQSVVFFGLTLSLVFSG